MSARRPLTPLALFKVAQLASFVVVPLAVMVACGSSATRSGFGNDDDSGGPPVVFGEGGGLGEGGVMPGIGGRDPVTCDEAAMFKTYVGCDYWPTVTDNLVANVFDFAVAVANGGSDSANVTVTNTSAGGQLVLYPGDLLAAPGTLTLAFRAGQTRANNALVGLASDASGSFKITSSAPGALDAIVDVNGWFE